MEISRTDGKLKIIMLIMYVILSIDALFYVTFVRVSMHRVVSSGKARSFLNEVGSLPGNMQRVQFWVCAAVILLGFSWILRQLTLSRKIEIVSIVFDFVLCLSVTVALDFNYNGLFLWAFANCLLYTKHYEHWYMMMGAGVLIYIATSPSAAIVRHGAWMISDLISVFSAKTQVYLTALFSMINAISIVLFFIFCLMLIVHKQKTIDNINDLYERLTLANEMLRESNLKYEELMDENARMAKVMERNRIAREVHDTIGHTLTGLAAGLDACVALSGGASDTLKSQLNLLSEVCRQGIVDVRKSVSQLRPDALERQNLLQAVRALIEKTEHVANTEISFDCNVDALWLGEDEEHAIYRLIQEGITNSIRHGKAKKIDIVLHRNDYMLRIDIRDDGQGADFIDEGFGLRHMRERVEMLQGRITFKSDNGFEIEAYIPMRRGEK
ncbi:MAG: sensor histidine kinase [Lachnospiraceae bacterium]|nr:sensor histidine kinase [Lachnospiraceae bacterium]